MATKIQKRTVSLSKQHANYIDRKVRSGAYASASEVVRAGLRSLQEQDQAIERWLREEVAPTVDRIHSGKEKLIPAEEVFANLRSRIISQRAKKSA